MILQTTDVALHVVLQNDRSHLTRSSTNDRRRFACLSTNDRHRFTRSSTNDRRCFTRSSTNDRRRFTCSSTNDRRRFTRSSTNDRRRFTRSSTNDSRRFTRSSQTTVVALHGVHTRQSSLYTEFTNNRRHDSPARCSLAASTAGQDKVRVFIKEGKR